MKKVNILLIAILLSAVTISGCKKSPEKPTTSAESMKFTVNGTAVSYNTCVAADATVGSVKQTGITGLNVTNNVPGNDNVEIDIIHDIATMKAGEVFPASTSFEQSDSMALFYSYFPDATDTFVTQPGNPQGTVTITSVGSGTISGTFSAKVFASDDVSGTTVKYTIASGTFTAKTP